VISLVLQTLNISTYKSISIDELEHTIAKELIEMIKMGVSFTISGFPTTEFPMNTLWNTLEDIETIPSKSFMD
jgi:hypothetical protein